MRAEELIFGIFVSAVTIAIQASITVYLGRSLEHLSHRAVRERSVPILLLVMSTTGVALMLGHFLEATVWAVLYVAVGAAPLPLAFDLALQNFTTLGYGDVLPSQEWRLLGPITAANGVLLFGWSTALLFAVLNRAIQALRLF